jgi:hypothetical protein
MTPSLSCLAVRPTLLAEVPTTVTAGEIRPIAGEGWLVSDPDTQATHILGRRLQPVAIVPGLPENVVSANQRHIAVATENDLSVTDLHGHLLWRSDTAGAIDCHLDSRDILWTLAGDLVAAADASTGRALGHTRLDAGHGWSHWTDDFIGGWTGLHLTDNGRSRSWLIRLAVDGSILLKPLAGLALTDFHRVEPQYLATSDHAARLTVCDIATNAIVAEKPVDTLAGRDATLLTAAIVSDSLVVAAVNLDDHTSDQELHVLLSIATLQPHSTVVYPHSAQPHRLGRSAELGTWLTRADTNRGATLCLWQLDGLLDDDPLPGQQALF